ncbi:MAG: DUF2281 domain-containing protein [Thermoguttaceae bacterium]
MTTVERLYAVSGELPPEAQSELLDFAEFLRQKCLGANPASNMALRALQGGLEDSATFAGSPMDIQEGLRREWH